VWILLVGVAVETRTHALVLAQGESVDGVPELDQRPERVGHHERRPATRGNSTRGRHVVRAHEHVNARSWTQETNGVDPNNQWGGPKKPTGREKWTQETKFFVTRVKLPPVF
jgi:hypothetical protein